MRKSKEFYANRENGQKIKQALAISSLTLHFPGAPAFNEKNFKNYIALQFHMALVYLAQPDLRNAIRLAEQAKEDMLRLPGMTRLDPRMQPFYSLLAGIYNSDVSREPKDVLSREQFAVNQTIAARYQEVIDMIKADVAPEPELPDIEAPEYALPNLQTEKDKSNDPSAKVRAEQKNKQARIVEQQAKVFLLLDEVDEIKAIDRLKELVEFHREYSEQFLLQPDFMNAVIHAKRAEAIMLEFVGFIANHPYMIPIYQTIAANFAAIAAKIDDELGLFAVDSAHYTTLASGVTLPLPADGFKRSRSASVVEFKS